jgi:predicted glycoside hydrolase/deacetylase ChbG (UPF0249 family)
MDTWERTRAGRWLIVNADDFGQSIGVNSGIARAHEEGIVTSASLMVRWPAAIQAAHYARRHSALSIGLHVDLGEWACRGREWVQLYEVVQDQDIRTIHDEIERQLNRFRELIGTNPTHFDSHQHAHDDEPTRTVLAEMARSLGVPLRGQDPEIRYRGDFYGQTADGSPMPEAISVGGLIALFESLPPGVTELGCHPGSTMDLETMYAAERLTEVEVLCDPRVRAALKTRGICLRSFGSRPRD